MPREQKKSVEPKKSGLDPEQKKELITLLIRRLVTRDSGVAGLILWVPTALGRDDQHAYAYTEGSTIYFCDPFFTATEPVQYAIILHELLHIVLRHPLRSKQIRLAKGDKYSPSIANACADAIVIRAIMQQKKIGPLSVVNPYIITAENLVSAEDLKKISAPQWTFEMLYNYVEKRVDKAVRDFINQHAKELSDDLVPPSQDQCSDPHMDEVETRVWKERLKRAAFGSEPGSFLREVLKDLPDTTTPWEKHFRDFMVSHVMPTTCLDWGRPSRRLLASRGRLGYYEPGIQRELGVKKAGIVIDTSGSIDDGLLKIFIAETNSIMEQTGCHIIVICADAAVQSVNLFQTPIDMKFECKGGGGTDFRPALKEMEKYDIDCCVYLTDMCGTFPDRAPSFPVLWATCIEQTPPFGRMVYVDPLLGR